MTAVAGLRMRKEMDTRYRSIIESPLGCVPRHHTLLEALESAASASEPKLIYHSGAETIEVAFSEVLTQARRWCALLLNRAMVPGERVPVFLPTSPNFIQAFVGVLLAGGIPVPLPFPLSMAGIAKFLGSLVPIIEDSGARTIVTSPQIREVIANHPLVKPLFDEVLAETDLGLEIPQTPARTRSVSSSDIAFIQYTSGTMGRPKGVVISQRALVANAFAIAHEMRVGPNDVGVHWLPMFHDMGLIGCLLTPICYPHPTHFISPSAFVMRPNRWLQLISELRGTVTAAPNFAYEHCVAKPMPDIEKLDLRSWRAALNGSEQVQPVTIERFTQRFTPHGFNPAAMTPVYGMAECTLAATFSNLDAEPEMCGEPVEDATATGVAQRQIVSVGKPVAATSVRITANGGQMVREGVVGQIEIKGPSLMDGYFRNEDASAAALSGGWLHTDDLGFIRDGKLYVAGRASDVIIKGGRNLFPADIERIALETIGPKARAVAAFGRASQTSGTEDLVVAVESAETDPNRRAAMAAALRAEVLGTLGVGIDDVQVCPVGVLPRTTSGKIRRRACAQALENKIRAPRSIEND